MQMGSFVLSVASHTASWIIKTTGMVGENLNQPSPTPEFLQLEHDMHNYFHVYTVFSSNSSV